MTRISWPTVVDLARRHVHNETASIGVPPNLRRVHYLLVSDPAATGAGYRNTKTAYQVLSRQLVAARQAGTFPDLVDRTRAVVPPFAFDDTASAITWLARNFTIDRRTYFRQRVVVVAEKDGLIPLIRSRFDWIDVTAVRGYTSLPHAQTLAGYDTAIYVGDYDPTGVDIDRDLTAKTGIPILRVALTADQVDDHQLPPQMAKTGDSRTARMVADHGHAVQVEVDALPPTVLLQVLADAIADATGLDIDMSTCRPVLPDVDDAEQHARDLIAAGGGLDG